MIDFIEYVVAELKSKRLSRTNAAALVREFARRAPAPAADAAIHPLLHRNTSDLGRAALQLDASPARSSSSPITRSRRTGSRRRRSCRAWPIWRWRARRSSRPSPARPEPARLELRNVVWAQPIVVAGATQVNIALLGGRDDADRLRDLQRGRGARRSSIARAVRCRAAEPAPARLDLEQLRRADDAGHAAAGGLYAACARMGLLYGPAFQGVTAHAPRQRPAAGASCGCRAPSQTTRPTYVLHPSLMDGALQAAVGLIEIGAGRPDCSRGCRSRWRRCASSRRVRRRWWPGCATRRAARPATRGQAGHRPVRRARKRLRADARVLLARAEQRDRRGAAGHDRQPARRPVWQAASIAAWRGERVYAEHHVILCELPQIESERSSRASQVVAVSACMPDGRTAATSRSATATTRWPASNGSRAFCVPSRRGRCCVQIVVAG